MSEKAWTPAIGWMPAKAGNQEQQGCQQKQGTSTSRDVKKAGTLATSGMPTKVGSNSTDTSTAGTTAIHELLRNL